MKIKCKHCDFNGREMDLKKSKQIMVTGKIHLRGDCPKCGRWIKYLSQKIYGMPDES